MKPPADPPTTTYTLEKEKKEGSISQTRGINVPQESKNLTKTHDKRKEHEFTQKEEINDLASNSDP